MTCANMEYRRHQMSIKDELDKICDESDIYTLILFLLFKLSSDNDYGEISQLAYILDKKSFLNFIRYYGGSTVQVPTLQEIENIVKVLTMYQKVHTDNADIESLLKDETNKYQYMELYKKICTLLADYDVSGVGV